MDSALKDILVPSIPFWSLIIRGAAVYLCILALIRISDKRQIAQMGIGEFVALLLISNAVQNSMNGGDNSLTGGVILASVLIALSFLVSFGTYHWRKFRNLIQGRPILLIHQGKVVEQNLKRELLTHAEFREMLRKQGIHSVQEVQEAVLESDGFLTITRKNEPPKSHSDDSQKEFGPQQPPRLGGPG